MLLHLVIGAALLAAGFGAGRIHSISSFKEKLDQDAIYATDEVKKVIADIKKNF
jgi:hypothetical protein